MIESPLTESPGRIVVILDNIQAKKAEDDPQASIIYWYKRIAQIRGDEGNGIGYKTAELNTLLSLSSADIIQINKKFQNPLTRAVAVVHYRLQQARIVATKFNDAQPLDDFPTYLLRAATTKEGFFDFINGGRAHILNQKGHIRTSLGDYNQAVNNACHELFQFRPPFADLYSQLIESLEQTVFHQVQLKKQI